MLGPDSISNETSRCDVLCKVDGIHHLDEGSGDSYRDGGWVFERRQCDTVDDYGKDG